MLQIRKFVVILHLLLLCQNLSYNMNSNELAQAIVDLKQKKNAVILGHYYQREEIQALSDFIGDSLALSQKAQQTIADIIVFCGVHFMAETAKILNPSRKVLLPDMAAGCSLAESCEPKAFAEFRAKHPDHIVISYVNCTAEIKAQSDIICTSGNAEKIVRSLPKDQKIIFAPDKNLGGYINAVTGREMLLWNGVCTVHNALTSESIIKLKQQHPEALVVAHPECNAAVLQIADFIGSTKAMLNWIAKSPAKSIIVGTEVGIVYEMKKANPEKEFITVPGGEGCSCASCEYMKLNTLEKLYNCLKNETPEIVMDAEIIEKAKRPIVRMLDISKQLGIIK